MRVRIEFKPRDLRLDPYPKMDGDHLMERPKSEAEKAKTPEADFYVIAWGLVAMSVCTSLPIEKAEARANAEQPTGISSRWRKSDAEHFANGPDYPNGMQCPDFAGHRHWLMVC